MAKKKKNPYAAKASLATSKKNITQMLKTKGNLKNTGLETVKDLAGVVIGGFAGAALGKPSLYVGAGLTAAGHYTDNQIATLLGIGMMAANGFQKSTSVEGLDGLDMQSVKKRVEAYKENFIEKTYIDKVLPQKASSAKDTTSGFDGYQFFKYPEDSAATNDLAALDYIDNSVEENGRQFLLNNNVAGLSDIDGIEGMEGMGGQVDARDYNF